RLPTRRRPAPTRPAAADGPVVSYGASIATPGARPGLRPLRCEATNPIRRQEDSCALPPGGCFASVAPTSLGDKGMHSLQLLRRDAFHPEQALDQLRRRAVEDPIEETSRALVATVA